MSYDLKTTAPDKLVAQQTHKAKSLTLGDLKKAQVPANKGVKTYMLCDISGSMAGTKIAELRRMLKTLWRPGLTVLAFNSSLYLLEESDVLGLSATGGTSMHAALQESWAQNAAHVILMSDGEPTDAGNETILIDAAQHKDTPVDTIGIGNKGGGGYDPEFLRELARLTGGRFTDCGEPIQLTNIVEQLLLDPPTMGRTLHSGTPGVIAL